jgi:hypothetical protein
MVTDRMGVSLSVRRLDSSCGLCVVDIAIIISRGVGVFRHQIQQTGIGLGVAGRPFTERTSSMIIVYNDNERHTQRTAVNLMVGIYSGQARKDIARRKCQWQRKKDHKNQTTLVYCEVISC